MGSDNSEITVSICCITYNHEKYIAQAIEGFLMQKTDFKFDIIIGEDCSTDRTGSIVKSYAEKYPTLIKHVSGESNVGSIRNQVRVMRQARGKYVAFCDGDDYWTDPLKLQKQVDFLENNPDYVICCHYSRVIDDSGNQVYVSNKPVPLEYSYEDLLLGKREETRIGTMIYRNTREIQQVQYHDWYYRTFGTDAILKLYIACVSTQKVYVLPEVMSCYRVHNGGVWSLIDPKVRKGRTISDFNIVVKHFRYSSYLKRQLLKIYLKDHFLFEVRNLKIGNALNTIAALI